MGAAYDGPNISPPQKDYSEKDQHCPLMGTGINYWSVLCQQRSKVKEHRFTCAGYPDCSGEKKAQETRLRIDKGVENALKKGQTIREKG